MCVHWTAKEFEKGANADTKGQVVKQGIAAEDVKIVNDEGEEMADGHMVEHSDGNNNGTADVSAGSAATFKDTHEEITLEDKIHKSKKRTILERFEIATL